MMKEKRKRLTREELREVVQQEIAAQQTESERKAQAMADKVLNAVAQGKYRVRWDGRLVVRVWSPGNFSDYREFEALMKQAGFKAADNGDYGDIISLWHTWLLELEDER